MENILPVIPACDNNDKEVPQPEVSSPYAYAGNDNSNTRISQNRRSDTGVFIARRLGKALEEMMGQEVNAIGLAYGDNPSQTFRGRQNGLPVTGYYTRASVEGAVASILSQVRVRATFAYLASRPEAIN